MIIKKGKYIVVEKFKFDTDVVFLITDDFPIEDLENAAKINKLKIREASLKEKELCFHGYNEHGAIGCFLTEDHENGIWDRVNKLKGYD